MILQRRSLTSFHESGSNKILIKTEQQQPKAAAVLLVNQHEVITQFTVQV